MARHSPVRSNDQAGSCLSKHRYETKSEALEHLAHNRREDRSGANASSEMHVYQCRFCGGFHIGHPVGMKARHIGKSWVTRPKRWERALGEE